MMKRGSTIATEAERSGAVMALRLDADQRYVSADGDPLIDRDDDSSPAALEADARAALADTIEGAELPFTVSPEQSLLIRRSLTATSSLDIAGPGYPDARTNEIAIAAALSWAAPTHTHAPGSYPGEGLRSGTLANHMILRHGPLLTEQLAANGYDIGRVSHTWLSDVHDAHHAREI